MEQVYTDKEVLGDALTAEKAATEHYTLLLMNVCTTV